MNHSHDFRFGLETEFLLLDQKEGRALWHTDLDFKRLNTLLEQIPLDHLPSLEGLELESPHRKLMPFIVEGYSIPDENFRVIDILPKGIEIRTPVCGSIEETLATYSTLLARLKTTLGSEGLAPVALSHHPVHTEFRGPMNKRRHDWWLWAMEVMTTYGPDINVSLPAELNDRIDAADLMAKVNHYGPAMTAFTVASPFRDGKLWEIRNKPGKSLRTYRRSVVAPPIEIHPDEGGRLEFKLYDMASEPLDYENGILLFLALVLDDSLKGRASNATRIYDLGAVARDGFEADAVIERAGELLESAQRVLPRYGFSPERLKTFVHRFDQRRTPADELIDLYRQADGKMETVLSTLARDLTSELERNA